MDYRMYSGGAPAGKNVIPLIKESLKAQGIKVDGPLKMVAFEGSSGTKFKLNSHDEETAIPSTGRFVTPYAGDRFMPVYNLTFTEAFSGDIYYII